MPSFAFESDAFFYVRCEKRHHAKLKLAIILIKILVSHCNSFFRSLDLPPVAEVERVQALRLVRKVRMLTNENA